MRTIVAPLALAVLGLVAPTAAQAPSPDERVAAIKQSLQKSQAQLRQYEWIETTTVSLKGDVKSQKQNRCYYGAEGKVQKVPVGSPQEAKSPKGLRGKIAKNKKQELTDYMQQAVALVQSYVPPNAAQIQRSKDAGKLAINILEPGRRVRLDFRDYAKPGDVLGIEVDLNSNVLLGLHVASYIDTPQDAVVLDVRFGTLADASVYAAQAALDAKAKQVRVVVQNSGYRRMTG